MTPTQRTHRNATLASALLVGLVAGSLGLWLGVGLGQRELRSLIEMPERTVHFSTTTRAVWTKIDGSTLKFAAYPTPDEAQFLRRFPWFNAPPKPAPAVNPNVEPATPLTPAPATKEKK